MVSSAQGWGAILFAKPEMIRERRSDMTVEPQKIELIASAIVQQASILRREGAISRASGMERRAAELRALCAVAQANMPPEFQLQAA
jgi:hypothetical protein